MNADLSSNTQAILLLTAPLIIGQSGASIKPLTASEYRSLARRLRELKRQPGDLLEHSSRSEMTEWELDLEAGRLLRLLDRGFLLAQAIERWRTRAIWVLSRADPSYPTRLKERLRGDAPPVLYGCGDGSILNSGGLAVVGSRNLDDTLIAYTKAVGQLTAKSKRTLVSGGAKGADQAAMLGAMESGGHSVGVLADSLERAVMRREYRNALKSGRLALISSYDPAARFHVGHAMYRNKLIYALADAALVVNSDYRKGGTWTGAVEQLDKLRFVPVYVRSRGECGKGLDALRERGAIPWPDPKTPEALELCLTPHLAFETQVPDDSAVSPPKRDGVPSPTDELPDKLSQGATSFSSADTSSTTPAEELLAMVTNLLDSMDGPKTEARVAEYLEVSKNQAGAWLRAFREAKLKELFDRTNELRTEAQLAKALHVSGSQIRSSLKRMVDQGSIEKISHPRPSRYRPTGSIGTLFDRQ